MDKHSHLFLSMPAEVLAVLLLRAHACHSDQTRSPASDEHSDSFTTETTRAAS